MEESNVYRLNTGAADVPGERGDQETQERHLPAADDEFDELRRRGYTGSNTLEAMVTFARNRLKLHAMEYTVCPYHSKRHRESLMMTVHRVPARVCNSITSACMVVVGNSEMELWTKALMRLLPAVEYESEIAPAGAGLAPPEGGA